ncbi:MAG TPA: hypothetical protein VE127_01735, partial [Solirubrobacteraceae bacterium]|nr:hypothetical protein [Solirubrobacteraceae bacterium]
TIEAPATTARPSFFATCFALSGLFFVLYPAIRPFSSEVGLDGAQAFASPKWILAHSLGILGFVLLALGTLGLYLRHEGTPQAKRMLTALVTVWLGAGLTIPYYGAEVFGLHAVGQRVISQNTPALLKPLTHDIRWEAGIYFILLGLLLLAIGAILMARAVWRSGEFNRWSGVPLATGLVLYIPQFSGAQPLRVAHGLLMFAGCAWLGWELTKTRPAGSERP